jgi:hypothetical protein
MSFWQKTKIFSPYDTRRLIDRRRRYEFVASHSPRQFICDIDKTYLETNFETFKDLVQTALERAEDKETVAGAREFLQICRWGSPLVDDQGEFPNGLHFVSSSPPQIRETLHRKLILDRIDWCSDTFKDQSYNLIKGRLSLLKNHIAYKSLAIFEILHDFPSGREFVLVGDNAEFDVFIYVGLRNYLAGVFDLDQYLNYLNVAVDDQMVTDSLRQIFAQRPSVKIDHILIREAPGYSAFSPMIFSEGVFFFRNYFESAVAMFEAKMFGFSSLFWLVVTLHNEYGMALKPMALSLEMLVSETPNDISNDYRRQVAELLDFAEDISAENYGPGFAPDDLRRTKTVVEHSADDIINSAAQWFRDR